jgi:hypothetical protein
VTLCGTSCVELSSDPKHCGGCGATCSSPPNGVGVCVESSCAFACNKPYSPCGSSCMDLATDPLNCGTCGNVCPVGLGGEAAVWTAPAS